VLARVELHRAVQQAAVAATDIDKFVAYLQDRSRSAGIRSSCGGNRRATCSATNLPAPETLRRRGPLFYIGSTLAPDLSLRRLQQRWAITPSRQAAGDSDPVLDSPT
jgi:hypothetical protein